VKFLDLKTDYAFKKVFGSVENKDILIEFLNAVLDLNYKIKDLTIVDPYNIPMLKGMKDTFVDVKAILEDDSKVIIEMQVLNHEAFEKRVLYNMAKNYSTQLDSGEKYHLLNPVIAITITDFVMFEDLKEYISYFKLIEKREFIEYSDDIELIFIELPKFTKTLKELKTLQEKYIYFIKNAGSLEYIPKELENLKKAFEIANEANLTKEELELQHKRKEFISIQKLAIVKAKNEGKEEKAIEIAKNLLDVLDDETISQKTGLSIEEVGKLRIDN
jgi:predicted transposase/invertase (TIGR01784 family)